MDEDKNSSNLPPVDNTGDVAVPENRQALFTPQPPEPVENTSDTGAQPKTSTYLSHPYLSNHPTQTFNTDTGDIILNSSEPKPKQNKRPFIIGGVILAAVVAICLVVLLLIQVISKPSQADVSKSFDIFKNYIEYGPDNSGSEDNWFLFQLVDFEYTDSDKNEYTKKASELFTDFREKLNASGIDLGGNINGLIATEESLFNFAVVLINIDSVMQPLIESYMSDGIDAAKGKITQVVPQESNSEFRNGFRNALIEYITSTLEIYDFYKRNYCIDDGSVNNECVALLDNDENYAELLARNDKHSSTLQRYFSRLETELRACTSAIQEGINE